jgi:ribonucleoside-diphosphate reductase alpha chain
MIVMQAGDRQKYLCQGQSLNIFFPSGATKDYLHKVHYNAWLYGTKGLYYLRTETSNKAENVASKVARDRLAEFSDTTADTQDECVSCQG